MPDNKQTDYLLNKDDKSMRKIIKIYIWFMALTALYLVVYNIVNTTPYKKIQQELIYSDLFDEHIYFDKNKNDEMYNCLKKSKFVPVDFKTFENIKKDDNVKIIKLENTTHAKKTISVYYSEIVRSDGGYYLIGLFSINNKFRYSALKIENENSNVFEKYTEKSENTQVDGYKIISFNGISVFQKDLFFMYKRNDVIVSLQLIATCAFFMAVFIAKIRSRRG